MLSTNLVALFQNNYISSDRFGNLLVKTHGIYWLIASFLLDACFGLSSPVFQNTLHPLVSSLLLSGHELLSSMYFCSHLILMVIGNLCFFKERQCAEREQGTMAGWHCQEMKSVTNMHFLLARVLR